MVECHLGASRMYFSVYSKIYTSTSIPTASNLHRWKRSYNSYCSLCNKGIRQTNKHVLSHCLPPSALNRYTKRHGRCSFVHHRAMDTVSKSEKFHHTCRHRRRRPQPDRGSFSTERPSRPSYSAESSNICAGINRLP